MKSLEDDKDDSAREGNAEGVAKYKKELRTNPPKPYFITSKTFVKGRRNSKINFHAATPFR